MRETHGLCRSGAEDRAQLANTERHWGARFEGPPQPLVDGAQVGFGNCLGLPVVAPPAVRSMDGKSTTISGKGVDDKGQQVDNVAVYDKQ